MFRNKSGITLSILVITVIVILILSGTIIINTNKFLGTKKLLNMENDIKILEKSIPIYYEQNKSLPIGDLIEVGQVSKFGEQKNINDNNEYYILNLELLPDLNLNYGYGKESDQDYYIVNTGSLTIYYLKGIAINGKVFYRINIDDDDMTNANVPAPEDFQIEATSTVNSIAVTGTTTGDLAIKGYKFRINNEKWTDIQVNGSYTFENLEQGTKYKVSMQAIDQNNNVIMAANNNLEVTTLTNQLNNGLFDVDKGVNSPDTSKLPTGTTKYVTWTGEGTYTEVLWDTPPKDWYDYKESKWANIKTTNSDKSLEAYWVWIPRFAYKLPESNTPKTIEVTYIRDKSTIGANGEKCYYSTDSLITVNGTGLYSDATELSKGTDGEQPWIIHPAFTFGETQLAGIWVAKYESSSDNPNAIYGGGNTTTLKVQIKHGVKSWKYISLANCFTVSSMVKNTGNALGTETNNTSLDTHLTKNIEWGAVGILSQSKYGYYDKGGKVNSQIWNNPNLQYVTGTVSKAENGKDAVNVADANCNRYNEGNGPKGSTTGNVYGIYDMAGGSYEYVSAIAEGKENLLGNPAAKYYDVINTNKFKIGDIIAELKPQSQTTWNLDYTTFPGISVSVSRGGVMLDGARAGIFHYVAAVASVDTMTSFRVTLVTSI